MHSKRKTRTIFRFLNVWVIGGAVIFASCLFFTIVSILWLTRSPSSSDSLSTAVLNVIEAPMATSASTQPYPHASLTPSDVPPSPPEGEISVGAYVQILDTGGAGLRLRSEPGLDGQVLLLGSEAEVFEVKDGPVEMDGYTWWYLVGPFDETRRGWAVANYLKLVQNP
jgi:hypothetical protein